MLCILYKQTMEVLALLLFCQYYTQRAITQLLLMSKITSIQRLTIEMSQNELVFM